MRAILIRHGKTAGNLVGRYIGRTDEPLCEAGRAEAERAKPDPTVRQVFVSPMKRAKETAAILFPNAVLLEIYDLREMDFGAFEGRSADEMEHDPAYRAWVDGMCVDACPGGESPAEFTARVVAAFSKTVGTAEGDPVFVVHGGVIMALLSELCTPKRAFYEWHVPNLGGVSVEILPDGTLQNPVPIQY